MLLVGRVIPWRSYVHAFGLPRSLRSCPNVVVAADGYYALMNEQFYFYCPDSLVASSLAKDAAAAAAPTTAITSTATATTTTMNTGGATAGIADRPPKRPHTARH
jgi:hypothetical protein